MKESCPNCDGRTGLREILYGLPDEPIDDTKYEIGGCIISPFQPTWACVDCGWRGWELNNMDGTKLSNIECPLCESRGKILFAGENAEMMNNNHNNAYQFGNRTENLPPNAFCSTCGWSCRLVRTYAY